jgi:hypothetical protein
MVLRLIMELHSLTRGALTPGGDFYLNELVYITECQVKAVEKT